MFPQTVQMDKADVFWGFVATTIKQRLGFWLWLKLLKSIVFRVLITKIFLGPLHLLLSS